MEYTTLLIIAGIFSAIALSFFALATWTPVTPPETVAQEKTDPIVDQTTSIKGDCSNFDCIIASIAECKQSETTITRASNRTQVITIGGNGTYQGRPVCTIGVNESATSQINGASPLQATSCKVPIWELQNLTSVESLDALGTDLMSNEHCESQVP